MKKKQLISKILNKLFFISKYAISFPIGVLLYLVFPYYKVKFFALFSERIGHYALNTELMLCTLETEVKKENVRYIFYTRSPNIPICNTQLHRMWKREIFIFPFPTIAEQIDSILKLFLGDIYKQDQIKITFEPTTGANDPSGLLKRIKTPHLKFTLKEISEGEKLIRQLGIEKNTQFVCLIVRDSEYLNKHLPGLDWSYHDFRNADVDNYKKAVLFLANKGYYVIRMGKFVEKPFNIKHEKIIDYATSPLRSDFLDIYLLSQCHFFISTATGLDCVPQIFRRPGIFTNVVLPTELLPWFPNKLFIPKKIFNKTTRKTLPFREYNKLMIEVCCELPMMAFFKKYNLEVIQNTEDEILDAVKEMEGLEKNNIDYNVYNNAKELQILFWLNYPKKLNTDYYIKVGNKFLLENRDLL